MTDQLTVAGPRAGAPKFTAGWIGVALFACAVPVINRDPAELSFSVVLAAIAVGVLSWYRMTTGRTVVIVGFLLGVLFTLQQSLFVASDITSSDTSFFKTTLVDMFGLMAGLLVAAGGIAGLRGRRNPDG